MNPKLFWVSPSLTLLLVAVVAAAWTGEGASPQPPRPSRVAGLACPMTSVEEKTAVLAFEEMMPVIRHPRCLNCHGGVNPFVPYQQGGHFGGAVVDTVNGQIVPGDCQDCHSELPGWDVPGQAFHFVGKSSKELCIQFKQRFPKAPDLFVEHIEFEPFSPQFIKAAFKGDRALNGMGQDIPPDDFGIPFVIQAPPGTLDDLVAKARAWGTAIGRPGGWTAASDCGCEIRHNGWVGTSSFSMTVPGNTYSVVEKAIATVWFELDDTLSRGVPEEYYRSSVGSIHWTTTYSGACVGTFSGTTPIGRGGDGNPLGIIQLTPRNNQVLYSVSTAPWQDQYYPITTVPCGADPPLQVPLPLHASFWWQPDPQGEVVSPDGKLLEGSYQQTAGQSTLKWSWSFRRTTP